MTKEPSSQTTPNPQDFGLPIVNTAPIKWKGAKSTTSSKAQPSSDVETEASAQEKIAAAKAMAAKKEEAIRVAAIIAENEKPLEASAPTSVPKKEKVKPLPKKSQKWVWPVAIILIGLISVIVWQMMGESSSFTEPETQEISVEEKAPTQNPPAVTESQEETSVSSEGVDSEQVIENDDKPLAQDSEITENGTTIEQSTPGELIRVETKPVPSQYFIVVGSLPNEGLALKESEKYWDRAETLYLLSPNPDSENYRLAIGRFSGFTAANEELQRVKSEYTEALWILKY